MASSRAHLDAQESPRKPRLVIVSSEVHHWTQLDNATINSDNLIEAISSQEYCTPKIISKRYLTTKLLNVFFTRAFASHLSSPPPIIVNTANPGYCYSSLRRHYSSLTAIFDRILELLLARSTEVGSRQLIWAALEGSDEEVHGQYMSNFMPEEPADYVIENEKLQEQIWTDTLRVLTKIEPKIAEIRDQ